MQDLLSRFADGAAYAKLLDAYRTCRSDVFHNGRREDMPSTEYPSPDPVTGERRRSVSLDETIEHFGKEGLATRSGAILLHQIVDCILLNRLIPELALWPRLGTLTLVTSR